ncbi:hypothetical protein GCM10027027_05070 [Neomicrococcus lactis]
MVHFHVGFTAGRVGTALVYRESIEYLGERYTAELEPTYLRNCRDDANGQRLRKRRERRFRTRCQ